MPIYEYECKACGGRQEVFQKMNDPRLTDCPACGAPELKKLISRSGFRLAGGGWYETDFKGGDSRRNIADKDTGDHSNKTGDQQAGDSKGADTNNKDAKTNDSKQSKQADSANTKAAASDG